ncbi:MAG: tetratricopeptide repeat protein, partial [Myxococcota bacterium]|nr:tetratricopeptide repeat protein [Myxococcota bacterium]
MKHERLETLLREYLQHQDSTQIHDFFDAIHRSETVKEKPQPTLVQKAEMKLSTLVSNVSPESDAEEQKSAKVDQASMSTGRFGEYEATKQLGRGGMGEVWQVKDHTLHRLVALKVMHTKLVSDPSAKESFEAEAQISAQLQHPGIVPLYDFGALPGGDLYFTMKEVEGQSLETVIQMLHAVDHENIWNVRQDGWSIRRLIEVFYAVCKTMAYVHSKGVVHCDLKPSNILLGDYGEVYVVDWGIAKRLCSNRDDSFVYTDLDDTPFEQDGFIVGTPVYMSPEQAWGDVENIGIRSDVYALGVILYEILTGEVAYQGSPEEIVQFKRSGVTPFNKEDWIRSKQVPVLGSEEATLHIPQGETAAFPAPSTFEGPPSIDRAEKEVSSSRPNVPLALLSICEKAMQYDLHQRYPDTSLLAQDIQSWLDGVQRKEKARDILQRCAAMEERCRVLLSEAQRAWDLADEQISAKREDAHEGWASWLHAQEKLMRAEEQEQDAHQLLQGALIYAPEMLEIHRRLLALEYKDFTQNLLYADDRTLKKWRRKVDIYLENIPASEAADWRNKIQATVDLLPLLRKRAGQFTGRNAQKREMLSSLPATSLLTLTGTAGVGKTHLAMEVGLQWREKTGAKILFCDCKNVQDEWSMAQVVAKDLHLILSSNEGWNPIVEELKRCGPVLIIVDHAEHFGSVLKLVLSMLFERVPELKVVLSSRRRLGMSQELVYTIQPMSLLEGVELFVSMAQKIQPDFQFSTDNRDMICQIVDKLDGLPLAIALAAARISILPLADIVARLSERMNLLQDSLRSSKQRGLQDTLDWSWSLLSDTEQSAFLQCSIFQGGFTLAAAEEVVSFSSHGGSVSVLDVLEALCDDHLLFKEKNDGGFRYQMLSSMQAFAHQKMNEGRWLRALRVRHARYYGRLYRRVVDTSSFWSLLEPELDNFGVGIRYGTPSTALDCCLAAIRYFRSKGPLIRALDHAEQYLAREDVVGDLRIQIQVCQSRLWRISGNFQQAREQQEHLCQSVLGLSLWSDQRDATIGFSNEKTRAASKQTIADALLEMGLIEESGARYDAALYYLGQAKMICEQEELHVGLIQTLNATGLIYRTQGKSQEALQWIEKSIRIADQHGGMYRQGTAYQAQGNVYTSLGMYKKGLQALERARQLYEESGVVLDLSRIIGGIGLAQNHLGDYGNARRSFEESIAKSKRIGNKRLEAVMLGNLGLVHYHLGDYQTALHCYSQSVQMNESIGNKKSAGIFGGNMGLIYADTGQYSQAMTCYEYALRISQDIGNKESEAYIRAVIGKVQMFLGQYESARTYYRQAIAINREIGRKLHEGYSIGALGIIALQLGEDAEAYALYGRAVRIGEETENPHLIGLFSGYIGEYWYRQGDPSKAQTFLNL